MSDAAHDGAARQRMSEQADSAEQPVVTHRAGGPRDATVDDASNVAEPSVIGADDVPVGRAARRVLADVAREPRRKWMLTVVGVRGSGKSVVLEQLARLLRSRGVVVHRDLGSFDRVSKAPVAGPVVPHAVIVDDAHHLDDERLDRLSELTRDPDGPTIVVAYRQWAARPGLRDIAATLDDHDSPVILGALAVDDVRVWASRAGADDLSDDEVAHLVELTGGMPWLVDRTLEAVAADDALGLLRGGRVPEELAERLALELGRLAEPVYELALALAVGFDLSSLIVPTLSHFRGRPLDELVDDARSAGILRLDDRLVPLIGAVLTTTTPVHRVSGLQLELLDALSAAGRSLDELAVVVNSASGFKDQRIADALVRMGDAQLNSEPARARDSYTAAIEAGADPDACRARVAQATLATGDLEGAGLLLERHFNDDDPSDVVRGVDVAAAHWAMRGMPSRSADVYRWLGRERVGASAPTAAVAFYGAGELSGALGMLTVPAAAFPTAAAVSARMAADGVRASLLHDSAAALPTLVRASATLTATSGAVPVPELPAALAAIVAMHRGDLATAQSVLDAAIAGQQGGPVGQPRLRLLRAWAAMLADDIERAHEEAAAVRSRGRPLCPRDEFFARALGVALARRADDLQGLMSRWEGARECLMSVSMGLFTLLPLGELVVAAARMRDAASVEPALLDAWDVLHRLGDPPLWSATLHWACVQAGILRQRPEELTPHAGALVRAASHLPLADALAVAGRAWVRVLGDKATANEVEAAARRLAAAGMSWDGARLAGHAAARVNERKDMLRLLQTARELHADAPPNSVVAGVGGGAGADAGTAIGAGPGASALTEVGSGAGRDARVAPADASLGDATGPSPRPSKARGEAPPSHRGGAVLRALPTGEADTMGLSAREREVASLVLEGKTYAEIGDALFISPRTAEHHMARIRRRIGASSRAEMLAWLRSALGRHG